jgi:hypothetical protein
MVGLDGRTKEDIPYSKRPDYLLRRKDTDLNVASRLTVYGFSRTCTYVSCTVRTHDRYVLLRVTHDRTYCMYRTLKGTNDDSPRVKDRMHKTHNHGKTKRSSL